MSMLFCFFNIPNFCKCRSYKLNQIYFTFYNLKSNIPLLSKINTSSRAVAISTKMSHNIKILPGATVCEDCTLEGDITIGGGTVIHPRVTIIAEGGPIIIAEYCIIEEYSTIILKKNEQPENPPKPLFIGAHNVFEVGCRLESLCGHIGESNVFECMSFVGVDVKIGSGCVIGASCNLNAPQTLPDNTVIWGSEHNYREALEKQPSQLLQLDFLSKVMPNYHRLRKSNVHKRQMSRQSQEAAK